MHESIHICILQTDPGGKAICMQIVRGTCIYAHSIGWEDILWSSLYVFLCSYIKKLHKKIYEKIIKNMIK
jgi:hypothetical protein